MRKNLLLSLIYFFTALASADTISLDYKGFYDRLKVVNKGDYHTVEIAFSVPNKADCRIRSGSITTDSKNYPLSYSKEQRLYIPFDEELKQDRALVNLDIAGEAKDCAIAMQVRASQPLDNYRAVQLMAIKEEMDGLLDAMQGFPLKYFRQPIHGLTFDFMPNHHISMQIDNRTIEVKGRHQFSMDQLKAIKELRCSEVPIVISPWVL